MISYHCSVSGDNDIGAHYCRRQTNKGIYFSHDQLQLVVRLVAGPLYHCGACGGAYKRAADNAGDQSFLGRVISTPYISTIVHVRLTPSERHTHIEGWNLTC